MISDLRLHELASPSVISNVSREEVESLARELLTLRKAFETPDCWEIAGNIFSTKEEALKPGFRGQPEPLYSKPDFLE